MPCPGCPTCGGGGGICCEWCDVDGTPPWFKVNPTGFTGIYTPINNSSPGWTLNGVEPYGNYDCVWEYKTTSIWIQLVRIEDGLKPELYFSVSSDGGSTWSSVKYRSSNHPDGLNDCTSNQNFAVFHTDPGGTGPGTLTDALTIDPGSVLPTCCFHCEGDNIPLYWDIPSTGVSSCAGADFSTIEKAEYSTGGICAWFDFYEEGFELGYVFIFITLSGGVRTMTMQFARYSDALLLAEYEYVFGELDVPCAVPVTLDRIYDAGCNFPLSMTITPGGSYPP